MQKTEIDGYNIEYEIETVAYNALYKCQINEKKYEVFLEALSEVSRPYRSGYFVYINEMLERFEVQPAHLEIIKKALQKEFKNDYTILEFR